MVLKDVPNGGSPTLRKATRAISLTVAAALLAACSPNVDSRIRTLYDEERHPGEPARLRIEGARHDPDRDVRATALVVMREIDAERAARMAGGMIDDGDAVVRAAAVLALSDRLVPGSPDPELLDRFAKLAVDDPAWQVRVRSLETLAALDAPAAREALGRALDDSVRHVRRLALQVAKEHPGFASLERLDEMAAKDPDWENRVAAAEALGAANDPGAYAGLDVARHDPNEFVRSAAARGLRALEREGVVRPAPPEPPPDATPKPPSKSSSKPSPKPAVAPPVRPHGV